MNGLRNMRSHEPESQRAVSNNSFKTIRSLPYFTKSSTKPLCQSLLSFWTPSKSVIKILHQALRQNSWWDPLMKAVHHRHHRHAAWETRGRFPEFAGWDLGTNILDLKFGFYIQKHPTLWPQGSPKFRTSKFETSVGLQNALKKFRKLEIC